MLSLLLLAMAVTPIKAVQPRQSHVYSGEALKQLLQIPHETSNEFQHFLGQWAQNIKTTLPSIKQPDPSIAFDWIPVFIGDASLNGSTLTWTSPCFNKASIFVNKDTEYTLTLHAELPTSNCEEEVYLITTPHGVVFHKVVSDGTFDVHWNETMPPEQQQWLQRNGFRIMRLVGSIDDNLRSIVATAELFLPAELTKGVWDRVQAYNVAFLKAKAYYDMPKRSTTDVIPDESEINEGDFFGVLRPDGLDPMLAWAMGAHTGHTTVALRFDGELYICESTTSSSYWPTNGIQKTPYRQWIAQAKAASFQVVHLPLNNDAIAKFNATAARHFFTQKAEGLDYGFANMLFSWVDLPEANYPGTLSSQIHEILVGWVDSIAPPIADLMWNRAFNKRLNTANLSTVEIYNTAASRGIDFTTLFALPEQDDWQYNTGYSMVCDVLVCRVWKAGGLMGKLTDDIQCTEFTNWDAYTLNIFNTSRPQKCVDADPSLPFCQILGDYRMSLPSFNTRAFAPHMAETCPRGNPPNWTKPIGC